ncbi:MAG TPA: hypothetical protein VMW36_08960 [Patescibacteria group bacterium]|nr:hypothetical protein [Patescibacteria group bacterium]
MEITIDIDSKDRANLLDKYRKALRFGKTQVTETVKGFHLRISSHVEDPWEILRIRHLIGDDTKRIEHDKVLIQLGHPELANRLFEAKKVNGKYVKEKHFDILKLKRSDNE